MINDGSVYDNNFTLLQQIISLKRRVENLEAQGGGGGSYVLPTASANVKGGVKIGSGLSMNGEVLSATGGGSYELPVASETTLGGIKVGDGLGINNSGYLFVQGGGGGGDLPIATNEVLGGVKIGNGIYEEEDGTIRAKETSFATNWLLSKNVGYNWVSEGFLFGFARGFSVINEENYKDYTTPLTFVNASDNTDTKTLYLQNSSYRQYLSFVPFKESTEDAMILTNNHGTILPLSGSGGFYVEGSPVPYLFDTSSQENAEPVAYDPQVTRNGGVFISSDDNNNGRYYVGRVWGTITQISCWIDGQQYTWTGSISYSDLFNTGTNILAGIDGYWLRNQIPTS